MTEQTPQQILNAKMSSIRYKVQNLQSEARLAGILDQVEDLDSDINKIQQRVSDLRAKGYVFGKGLEAKSKTFGQRWDQMQPQIRRQVENQVPVLQMDLTMITAQLNKLEANAANPTVGQPMAEHFERSLDTFASKVTAARNAIQGTFDSFSREITQTKQELDRIEWMLEQLAQACFKLLPTEGSIMAVNARYARDERMDKDDPKGVLYLTDQRLIFEQKEEVATKKFLFIATDKQTVQKLILEVPVALVEKAETSKKGLFKNEDHLTLAFGHGAPVRSAWFHLEGQDCNAWQALINRACAKDFENERAVALDEKVVEKVRSVPTQCPNCGAPLNQQVLRGMDSVTCAYCQHVVRI